MPILKSRVVALILSVIFILPALCQSREVLVLEDSVATSIFGALDFVENAYEDNAVVAALSSIPYKEEGSVDGTLDALLGAYGDDGDLFRHRINSPFGFREDFGRMHWGVDLSMELGEGIAVPLAGTVLRTGYDEGGYGRFVVIAHSDGLETRYAHLRDILVKPGEKVTAGSIVATCGNTGNSTGPHLHFEVRRNGMPVNPTHLFHFEN